MSDNTIDPHPESDLDSQFQDAAGWLSTSPAAASASNDLKLQVYGLFKVATVSPTPNTPAPSFFSHPATKAKHAAWVTAGKSHTSESAKNSYLELAKGLGWTPAKGDDEEDEGRGDFPRKRGGGTAGVGGGAVSIMQVEERDAEDEAHPIHTAAMDGSLSDLQRLISGDSNLLNKPDEFGLTPLHYASDRGHASCVEYLLAQDADRTLKEEDGSTALELAEMSGQDEVIALFKEKRD